MFDRLKDKPVLNRLKCGVFLVEIGFQLGFNQNDKQVLNGDCFSTKNAGPEALLCNA